MAKDLVCGMEIKEEETAASSLYKGEKYYFCTKSCKQKFDENPEKYVRSEGSEEVEKDEKAMPEEDESKAWCVSDPPLLSIFDLENSQLQPVFGKLDGHHITDTGTDQRTRQGRYPTYPSRLKVTLIDSDYSINPVAAATLRDGNRSSEGNPLVILPSGIHDF